MSIISSLKEFTNCRFLQGKRKPEVTGGSKKQIWSIGIYSGESPCTLRPSENARNPVLTAACVSDVPAMFVADPFMIKVNGRWYMFFEVMNLKTGKGEIGLAISNDGVRWNYEQIVLREPFHLSYPYVFEWDNEFYMIPESYRAGSARLYRASKFPTRWSFIQDLLTGDDFEDPSVFRFNDRWWLLTDLARPPYYAGILRLFSAENLMGPWAEHPKSPVIKGNPHIARPAGRVLVHNEKVVRFTQDCYPTYGTQVRAFEITELTDTNYQEREVCNAPVLRGSGKGWNESGMHHIDPHRMEGEDRWIACVDGFLWEESRVEANKGLKLQSKALVSLKRHLRSSKPYIVAREIKWVLEKHFRGANGHNQMISLKTEKPYQGNVLLSYVTDAFLSEVDKPVPYSHTAFWESLQIAKTYLDFGYCVDVISSVAAAEFRPQKSYALFTGHRINFVRIARRLNADCVKVLHCDTAHSLFHSAASLSRLLALQQRKGITLPLLKFGMPDMAIEHADCATILGNEFTTSTYKYANKPIYRIPISAPFLYPWPEAKDFEACRKHFLWLGSRGFVHKGLDLVLEAFAEMPEYHLTVCGSMIDEAEKDFVGAFYKELYQTSNIRAVGWIDVGGADFLEIADSCIGVIFPSCSEGGGGGVVTCMHAGLIPIVSYESSVDVEDFGVLLQEPSIEGIKDSVRRVGSLPVGELRQRARRAWEFARANHTRDKFAAEYRKVAGTIISTYGHKADCVDRTSHRELDKRAGDATTHGAPSNE